MTIVYQTPATANTVLEAIAGAASESTTAVRCSVAYVTREGARLFVGAVKNAVGADWNVLPKALVTCFDFGTTEPGALEYLTDQGFEIRIANLGADGRIRISSNPSSFHPKLYILTTDQGASAVVGSANLSRRALTVNTEAVSALNLPATEAEALWSEIESNSIPLTDELLAAYKAARPEQKSTPAPDEPPVPPEAAPGALPTFRDAVESEDVDPTEHQAFWVEVGGPSGGSGNQLELPRRAQRFFGCDFDQYDDDHHVIGNPVLATPAGSWDRPLTWHGNNRMERINLPTTTQSGLTYGHQVVLFQRSGMSFELTVASPDSSRAKRWLDESAAAGTLFRFSAGSNRRCGLI